jgi:hypothetical protein
MSQLKALIPTILALCAFGAFAASSALATDANSPSILVLEGGKATELEGTFKSEGTTTKLIQLNGEKTLESTGAETKLKNCKEISGLPSDTNLCEPVAIVFTGNKQAGANCRSENSKGEKDAIETVLALLDLHLAAEESLEGSAEMKLQPLLLARILGTAKEEELSYVCGLVKIQVKGVLACLLLPGLATVAAGGKYEIVCAVDKTTHDPITGHCETLCEIGGKAIGMEADLNGKEFKDAWWELNLKGSLNKSTFIDD